MEQKQKNKDKKGQENTREADPYLSQTDSGQFLSERLGPLQGFLVVQHWNAHHGSFNVGAGHHQDLSQSARHGDIYTQSETWRKSMVEGLNGSSMDEYVDKSKKKSC